jgi:hypothetical protein
MEPKYPTAGAIFLDDCQEATAVRVWVPKYPVAPAEIEKPPPISALCKHFTSAPEEPMVKLRENEQEDAGVDGVEGVPPVREALTFAIVVASAPNEESNERID